MIAIFPPEQPLQQDGQPASQHVYRFLRELTDAAQVKPVATQEGDYKASPFELVLCDPTGGGFTVTLPKTIGNFGARVWIKNHSASGNTITVVGHDGDENIDGATSFAAASARGWWAFVCVGSEWIVEGV